MIHFQVFSPFSFGFHNSAAVSCGFYVRQDCRRVCSVRGNCIAFSRSPFSARAHHVSVNVALFSRGKWVLLDGDKIAALCAAFIHEEMAKLGLDKVPRFSVPSP